MIRQATFYLVNRPALLLALLFVMRIVFLTALEQLRPAHPVRYREVMLRDIAAALVCGIVIIPAAGFVNRWVAFRPPVPHEILSLPLAARFLLYLVIADFGHYWVHRLMHTRYLWSTHKWHHVPTYMYWLAGARGSLLQQILVNVPYLFAAVLLVVAPWWIGIAILLKNTAQNDWMHLNVSWGSDWLEWLIVTPRYHHVHHSDDPRHYRANLGSLFPIWDRLFGTYLSPSEVRAEMRFGIGEHPPAVRLAIGI